MRIGGGGLRLVDPEECGIEAGDVVAEGAPVRHRPTRRAWLGVVVLVGVASVGRNLGVLFIASKRMVRSASCARSSFASKLANCPPDSNCRVGVPRRGGRGVEPRTGSAITHGHASSVECRQSKLSCTSAPCIVGRTLHSWEDTIRHAHRFETGVADC